MDETLLYDQLAAYTLNLRDPAFPHQHVVDAFTAQTAEPSTKPIALTFALAGLFLHRQHGWTGRSVQLAHVRMARQRRTWPILIQPEFRGTLRVADVLATPEGDLRLQAIHAWAADVWKAYSPVTAGPVRRLLRDSGILG